MTERARVEAAFEQALDHDAVERSAFLADLRATEPEIADEVEQLLLAHDTPGILDAPVQLPVPPPPLPNERRIGPYRVVNELGRGGMGVVYLAERDDGQFRRRVAVKLLRGGSDADDLHHRFVAERQILATLDHPNIAQLIDGGITDGKLPYLVMEYVDGLPITDYCDRHRLGVRQRLRLFMDVCAAVHHAHRNLIIHRDLKPGNILVTQQGQVKLLDFGIAKLLNPGLSAIAAPVTRHAQRVLTPEYASPEQLRGEPLSTTSDVYSLGVILHELLTGRRPVTDVRLSAAALEAGDAAADRDSTPDQLSRALRGDVDAILATALRAEPSRRYGSAELFAQDIANYLDGLPVAAQKGNSWYHGRKFMRRHWLAATAMVVAVVSLGAGAGVALRQRAVAQRERESAQQALLEARRITDFLIGLFEANDPAQLRGRALTAQDLLERGRQQAEGLRDQPLVQARMLDVIGRVYHATAQYSEARGLLERALSIREAHLGPDHPDVAETLSALAQTLRFQSRYVEADAAAQRALDIRLRAFGRNHRDVASSRLVVATMAVFLADLNRALEMNREAVSVLESLPGSDSALVGALVNLGSILARRAQYEEAEQALRRAIDINRRMRAESPQLAGSLLALAYLLDDFPEHVAEADSLYRVGIEMRRRTLGNDHPLHTYALGDYALFLGSVGRHAEALKIAERHMALAIMIFGPEHPRTAEIMATHAHALANVGRRREAIEIARRSLEIRLVRLGRVHNSTANAMSHLATLLHDDGQTAEAERLLEESIDILRTNSGGVETGLVAIAHTELARFQFDTGRYAEAEQSLLHAVRIYDEAQLPATHKDYQTTLRALVKLYERTGRRQDAARYGALVRT